MKTYILLTYKNKQGNFETLESLWLKEDRQYLYLEAGKFPKSRILRSETRHVAEEGDEIEAYD